ncbi:hypothetical protein [Mesorhizobium sp.]|uniref:hypothetical protein n=1 Tax=Mesorhizobium sp. TaxID=1871066 RepID=UPI00121D9B8F|nr:hypothetical protein [Mesorhizobium sp.]TIL36219.1 MAG: hypothetical protein E5Y85_00910 [Mesorhizobium sp.]
MKIVVNCKWQGTVWRGVSSRPYAGATIDVKGSNPADLHARALSACNALRPDIGIEPLEIELNFESDAP